MSDRGLLECRIAELVEEYETLHSCEVSSLWIEHLDLGPKKVQVTVTTGAAVKT